MRKLYLGEAKEIIIDKETEIELGLRKNKIEEVIETLTKIPRKMDGATYKIFEAKVACDMAIKAIRFQQSVVMCKDCTEYDIKLHACLLYDSIKSKNDYCSRGERRDEK